MHTSSPTNDHPLLTPSLLARLQAVTAHYWRTHGHDQPGLRRHTSWCGFYLIDADQQTMTLICREPKPACSPIGLQGMCGRGWRERKTFIVPDVKVLGENYIACDARDISELVVPIYDLESGTPEVCIGVFDVDSYARGAFTEQDAEETTALLREHKLLTSVPIMTIR